MGCGASVASSKKKNSIVIQSHANEGGATTDVSYRKNSYVYEANPSLYLESSVIEPELLGSTHAELRSACLSQARTTAAACAVTVGGELLLRCDGTSNLLQRTNASLLGRKLALGDHEGPISCCTASENGKRWITGSWDGTLRVWERDEERSEESTSSDDPFPSNSIVCTKVFQAASGIIKGARVVACALHPDGCALLSCASGSAAPRLWDVSSGEWQEVPKAHKGAVRCCCFSTLGTYFATGGQDKQVAIYSSESRQFLRSFQGHQGEVLCCAIDDSTQKAVTGGTDNILRVWDVETGAPLKRLWGHRDAVTCCALLAEPSMAVSGSADGTLRLWRLERYKCAAVLDGHGAGVRCCAASSRDLAVLSGDESGSLRSWSISEGTCDAVIIGAHLGAVHGAALLGGRGSHAITCGADGYVMAWDVEVCREARYTHAAISPDGLVVMCAYVTGAGFGIKFFAQDADEGRFDLRQMLQVGEETWTRTVVAGSGELYCGVTGAAGGTVSAWLLAGGDLGTTPQYHALHGDGGGEALECVACSRADGGGFVVAAGFGSGALHAWYVAEGGQPARSRYLHRTAAHEGRVTALSLFDRGSRAATASEDLRVRLWDAATGEMQREIRLPPGPEAPFACAAAELPLLLTCADGASMTVWDAESGAPLAQVGYRALPDARQLAVLMPVGEEAFLSGSTSGALKLWDLGKLLGPLRAALSSDDLSGLDGLRERDFGPLVRLMAAPIHVAAGRNDRRLCRRLLAGGFVIDQTFPGGFTPLMVAVMRGHLETVRLLLNFGADDTIANDGGETAIQIATRWGMGEIRRELSKNGVGAPEIGGRAPP